MTFTNRLETLRMTATVILLAVAVILLCSCSIASKKDLIRYAKNHYGACEFISEEHKGSGNSEYRTVYLKDKETGIEYKVTTRLSDINIDGSVFGYTEGKYSDFEQKYTEYVLGEAGTEIKALEREYGLVCDFPNITFNSRVSGPDAEKAVKKLSEIVKKYDTKDLCPSEHLVFAEVTVYVGAYDAKTDKWSASSEYEVIDYVHAHYDADAVFCDSIGAYLEEFLSYDEISKLISDNNESQCGKAYYFRDKDGNLFIAIDLRDFGIDNGGIRLFRDTSYGMEEIYY